MAPGEYKPFDTRFGDVPPLAAFGSGYVSTSRDSTRRKTVSRRPGPIWGRPRRRRQVRKVENAIEDIVTFEEYMLEARRR